MMTMTVAAPQTSTTTWNIDPAHSVAEFKVKHMMISNVKGQFSKLSGTLSLDESGHHRQHWSTDCGSLEKTQLSWDFRTTMCQKWAS